MAVPSIPTANPPIYMTQSEDNDVTMFGTVRDFMGNHTTDTANVPAIATAVSTLTGIISQIDTKGTAQATPLTGIAADKDVSRTALEEAVFVVSEALSALAAATNNNTLLDEVAISRPRLDRLGAEDLDVFATRVAERGASNQTALTATYAISTAQVTAITTARTAFAPWVNKPRTAVAERSGQTATIPALIREAKLLLRQQLDPLMSRYRITNPTLFASYRTARAIVDRHGAGGGSGGGSGGGTVPPKAVIGSVDIGQDGNGHVTWTAPAGVTGTKRRVKPSGAPDSDYVEEPGLETGNDSHLGPQPAGAYDVEIAWVNATGTGEWSDPGGFTIP